MATVRQSIVVVGGNGFLGSALCRRAIARGIEVTSISSSGQPFTTPKGHTPAWTSKVQWHAASALQPSSYASLLNEKTAVVHTLGVLLEGGYKDQLRNSELFGLASSFVRNFGFDSRNPLAANNAGEYETINRDSALRVFETYANSQPPPKSDQKTFIYISAEDVFRPFVPRRYIDTKMEAEMRISEMCEIVPNIRDVFIRPGLMYHPHLRPLTTPLAVLLDISSRFHRNPPIRLPAGILPASILRSIATETPESSSNAESPRPQLSQSKFDMSSLESIANLLEVPPMHVDQVADAIITIIQNRPDIRGPVGVEGMREVIGWEIPTSKTTSQAAI